ncbi:MAG: mechanosensitive ion channel domain-containing protein [Ginsengibacter sp.]
MKLFSLVVLFILSATGLSAQVKDTIRAIQIKDTVRTQQLKDTSKAPGRSFEASLFDNDDSLTRNDYLLSIEKVFQLLNKASALSQSVPAITTMAHRMGEDDSALNIIKDRLSPGNDKALNVRSLQMFSILLEQIKTDTKEHANELNQYDSILDRTKKEILDLRKDTVIRHIFRDSVLKASFKPQLQQLHLKWKKADSLIKYVNSLIDNTLALSSDNLITTTELQLQAESMEKTTGSRAFSKERSYLWESWPTQKSRSFSGKFKRTLASEKKITQYYFSHTHYQINLLLLTGLLFFFWVSFNFRSLKRRDKISTLQSFQFRYINALPFFASLVFMLNLAPLFDLDAPVVYIDTVEFLLMFVLTFSFRKRLPQNLFYLWIIFIALFLLSFSRYLGLPFYLSRWLSFILNSLAFLLGIYAITRFKKQYGRQKIILLAAALYTLLSFLAITCNLFGRITLMQIFSSTATYAFIQTVALLVFKQSVTEAFLLQIQSSRVRKDYPENFEPGFVVKGISRMVIFCSVVIWLVVFTTNLNLFDALSEKITKLLSAPRIIGSFSFTFGGMILFLAIIWLANFLQKYISYFFGDIGDDASFNNKSHRSRLLITRLILLIGGFLLAIAASGLPVDRITVILGALGVGIGLGLQSIVNNFVSGIILIFDRTLRIGDTVEIGDRKGRVKEISVRSSTLLTPEGAEVIIPNGDILSHNIVNWTLSNNNIRIEVSFTVDKFVSSEDIRKTIIEIIHASPDVLTQKEPEVFIDTVTSQSTQLKIYFWCKDVTKTELARSEVYTAISKHLEEKGVKIL